MAKNEKSFDFEMTLKRLEEIVEKLENENTPLEKSVELFEEGKKLSSKCLKRLKEIEQKVKIIIDKGEEVSFEDFAPSNDNLTEDEND